MKRLELGSTPKSRGPIFRLQDAHNRDTFPDPLRRAAWAAIFASKSPPKPRFPAFSCISDGSAFRGQNPPFWLTQSSMAPLGPRLEPKNIFRKYFCRPGIYLTSKPRINIDYSKITTFQTMMNTGRKRTSLDFDQ